MSLIQKLELSSDLRLLQPQGISFEFHHGDCIGADEEADGIARNLGGIIHIHHPIKTYRQANCYQSGDILYARRPYIARDHDIVNIAEYMYAAPKTMVEVLRSGTWATIRYARKRNKPIKILERGK
jgi:hypothetical protein